MRDHLAFVAAAAALCGACGSPATPLAFPVPATPPCEARLHGQIIAEHAAVDVSYSHVYWMDYNTSRLQRRSRGGGEIEDLASSPEEHLAETIRLAGDHLYWTSNAEIALYRIAVAGGAPERLIDLAGPGGELEVAGTVVYVGAVGGEVEWWRFDGTSGRFDVDSDELLLAARGDVLYIGAGDEILRVTDPTGGPSEIARADGEIDALAITATMLWWTDRTPDRVWLKRQALDGNGPVEVIADLDHDGYILLAAVDSGVFLSVSNLVSFAGDRDDELVPMARAATEIGSLRASADSVFVGTSMGSVEELCPDLANPLELVAIDPDSADEYYASGELMRRETVDGETVTEEGFYADGTPMTVAITRPDGSVEMRGYYANGQLAYDGGSNYDLSLQH